MADINELKLPALADRDLDLNQGVATEQEQLFNRPWDNTVQIPVPSLPTGQPKVQNEEDKIAGWFHDNTSVETNNPLSYENTHVSNRTIPDADKNRYNWFYPDRNDQEDIAFKQQGTGERLAKSVANMVPHFTHTLLESVTAPLAGVGYLLDGNKTTGFVDNPYTKWLDTWGQGYNIYESDARKNANWWSPTYWGSANSLNSVLGTIGDLAAFYVTGLGAGKLVGGVTGGFGRMLGNTYDANVQGIAKLASVIPEGQEGKVVVQELTESLNRIKSSGMAAGAQQEASAKLLTDLSKKYTNQLNTFNKVQQASIGVVTNIGMAQSSAHQTGESMRQKLTQKIYDEGRQPTEEELAHIDDIASQASIMSGLVMTVMGATTLHGFLKGSLAKKEGEQLYKNEINDIIQNGTAKRIVDGVEREMPTYIAKSAQPLTSTSLLGKIGERSLRVGKKISEKVDPWTGLGFMEFAIAPAAVDSYYEKKYDKPDSEWLSNLAGAIGKNVGDMFSKEGAGSFFTGLIAGSIGVHGKAWEGLTKSGKEASALRTTNINNALSILNTGDASTINDSYSKSSLKAFINSAKRGEVLRDNYIQSIREGDKNAELTLRQQQWENYLYPRIKFGLKSYVDKELLGERKIAMTDEGIRSLQPDNTIEPGDNIPELRQKYYDHLDNLQTYADNAQKYYDALQLRYGGILGPDGKPMYNDEHMEKLMVISGAIDDKTKRINEISDELRTSKLSADPKFQQRLSDVLISMEGAKNLEPILGRLSKENITKIYKEIDDLSINPGEKEDMAGKFGDMLKMQIQKKLHFKEYNDIINSPADHADTVTENAVATEPQEPGKKILGVKTKNKQPMDLEIGTTYTAGEKISPTKKGGKYSDFFEFKILSEKTDETTGMRKFVISYDGGNKTKEIDENVLSKYKIGALDKMQNHPGASYWYRNRNKEFSLKEGNKVKRGELEYDSETESLFFREYGSDTRQKISKADLQAHTITTTTAKGTSTYSRDAKVKIVGDKVPADEEFENSKLTEKEQEQRVKELEENTTIIHDLIKETEGSLKSIEDDIINTEIKVHGIKSELDDIKNFGEDIEKEDQEKTKKQQIKEVTEDYSEQISDIEKKSDEVINGLKDKANEGIDKLQEDYDTKLKALEERESFKKLNEREKDAKRSRVSSELQAALDRLSKRIDGQIKEEEKRRDIRLADKKKEKSSKINSIQNRSIDTTDYMIKTSKHIEQLSGVLQDSENNLKTLNDQRDTVQTQLDYINSLDPNDFPGVTRGALDMINEARHDLTAVIAQHERRIGTLEKFIKNTKDIIKDALDRFSSLLDIFKSVHPEFKTDNLDSFRDSLDDTLSQAPGVIGEHPFLDDLVDIKKELRALDDVKIKTKESDITRAQKYIDKYLGEIADMKAELASYDKIYDAFNVKFQEYERQRLREELLNSPENKAKLARIQGIQTASIGDEVTPVVAVEKRVWNPPVKNIATYTRSSVLSSDSNKSILPVAGDHEARFSNYFTNRNLNYPSTERVGDEVLISDYPDWKKNERIIVITANNQQHYFNEAVIPDNYQFGNDTTVDNKTNTDKAAVAFIQIFKTDTGDHFVGDHGQLLGKIDSKQTKPDNTVLSLMEIPTAENRKSTGKPRFSVEQGQDVEAYIKQAKEQRKALVDNTGISAQYQFDESFGIPNERIEGNTKEVINNSAGSAKLIVDTDKISGWKGAIQLANISTSESGKAGYVVLDGKQVMVPIGQPVLTFNHNKVLLNPRRFSEKEPETIYRVIKAMSEDWLATNDIDNVYTKYLSSILYFSKKVHNVKGISNNQLYFDGKDLAFKYWDGDKQFVKLIPFEPSEIDKKENKEYITDWLSKAFHSISAGSLKEDGFTEITGIRYDNGKPTPVTRNWHSYEDYLGSSYIREVGKAPVERNPDQIPMTVNIRSDVNPMKGKYISPIFKWADIPNVEIPKPAVEVKKEPKPEPVVTTKPGTSVKYDNRTVNEYTDPEGNKYTFTADLFEGQPRIRVIDKFDKDGKEIPVPPSDELGTAENDNRLRRETVLKGITETKEVAKPVEPIKEPIVENLLPSKKVDVEDDIEYELALLDGNREAASFGVSNGDMLREVVPGEEILATEDIPALKQFMSDTLPGLDWDAVPEVIKTGRGTAAWGQYKDHYIQVYKDSPLGTGYHEAFHGVKDSYLTDKQWQDIYQEFKNRKGSYTDRFGNVIEHGKASELQAEEQMAEEFRQFRKDNPKYTKPSKVTTWFKKLWNFLKEFIGGKPETIEGVFKKMNSSYYRDSKFIDRQSGGVRNSAMKGRSKAEAQYILHGITSVIVDNLRRSNGDMMRASEGSVIGDMIDNAFKRIQEHFDTTVRKSTDQQILAIKAMDIPYEQKKEMVIALANRVAGAKELWEYTKANKADVTKDLERFLKKFRVSFAKTKSARRAEEGLQADEDAVTHEQEVAPTEQEEEYRDRGYDRQEMKIDLYKNTPAEVKLMFSFLTRPQGMENPNAHKSTGDPLEELPSAMSPAMLPIMADGYKLLYQTLDTMAGTYNPNLIKSKTNEMAITDPALVKIYNGIYKAAKSLDDWRLRISYNKLMAKVKPLFVNWHVTEDGRSYIATAESSGNIPIAQWEANVRNSDIVTTNTAGDIVMAKRPETNPTSQKTTIQFLEQAGFSVSSDVFAKLGKESGDLVKASAELYTFMKPGTTISRKAMDAGPLREIAKLLAKADTRVDTQHTDPESNTIQNHILFNRLNRMVADIMQTGTLKRLQQLNPDLFSDSWSKNGLLLQPDGPLFDANGHLRDSVKNNQQLAYTITEGLINETDDYSPATTTKRMNKLVRFMNTLNLNLHGVYLNFIAADSNTESGMMMKQYISVNNFKNGSGKEIFHKQMLQYLNDEVTVIQENRDGTRELTENARKNDAGYKLQVFEEILPDNLKTGLYDYLASKDPEKRTLNQFLNDHKKQYTDAIDKYINDMLDEQFAFMENNSVLQFVSEKEGYKIKSLNTDFTKSMGYGDKLSVEQIKKILEYRQMNLAIHNTEMRKLFYGPFYEVPDAEKRDKLSQSGTETTYANDGDYNTWMNQEQNKIGDTVLQSGDFAFNTYKDNFNVFTFDHDKGIESYNHSGLEKSIGKDKAVPYKKIEEMDAQGIMLDTAWKDYVLRSGDKWTPEFEAQHQYDIASATLADATRRGIKLSEELRKSSQDIVDKGNPGVEGIGTPRKPSGTGFMNNRLQRIPFAIKTSIMRLTYPIAKGRGLEDLYWWMHDNQIHLAGPKSFQKVGRLYNEQYKGLPSLYTVKDGKVSMGLVDVPKKIVDQLKMNINWSDFNKILETEHGADGRRRASQIQSLVIVNSFDDSLPVDFMPDSDFQKRHDEWMKMDPDQQMEMSKRYKLFTDNNDALSAITNRGIEHTVDALGVNKNADGTYTLDNPERLVKYLQKEVERKDLPDNVADALDWEYNPDTGKEELKYHIESLPNYRELRSIIWSVVDKQILRPKLNGTDYILSTNALTEKKGLKQLKNGQIVSSNLKFYEEGPEGTVRSQAYLPNYFRKELDKWSDRTGKQLPTDAQLYKHLNTPEGKKLLTAIGFRIPTQGMNSIDSMEIVPWETGDNGEIKQLFLPAEMGYTAILPAEFVTKVGLDFDVDKMPTYHYNFYIDGKGLPNYIDFITDTTSISSLKKIYEQRYTRRERDESSSAGLLSAITGELSIGENIPTEKEFIKKYQGKDPYFVNSDEAIQNKYFETLHDLVLLPGNFEQLVTPNSSEQMKSIRDSINKKLGLDKDKRGYARFLDPVYMTTERQKFLDAKGNSIGIAAQNNTYNALAQSQFNPISPKYIQRAIDTGKLQLDPKDRETLGDMNIWLPHKQVMFDGQLTTTYSSMRDRVGNYISDVISQFINGSVDAVKDDWLIDLIKDKDLLSTAMFLGRTSVDADYVFHFINQPIIQEYVKQEQIQKTVRGLNPDINYRFADKLKSDTMMLTYTGVDNYGKSIEEPTPARDKFITMEELDKGLIETGKGKKINEMSPKDRLFQRQVLNEFLKYKLMGEHSLKDQMALKWDNLKSVNDNDIKIKNARVEHATSGSMVMSSDNILKNTFQGTVKDAANVGRDIVQSVLPLSEDVALAPIYDQFTDMRKRLSNDKRADVMLRAVHSYIDYLVQVKNRLGGVELNKRLGELLLGPDSTAKRLSQKKKELKGDIKSTFNNVLANLSPSSKGTNAADIKNIALYKKPTTGLEKDLFTEALQELGNNPNTESLYQRIVLTSALQTGSRPGIGSFNELIPHADYLKYTDQVLKTANIADAENFNKTKGFYRNNWREDIVVPKVTPRIDKFGTRYVPYYDTTGNAILENIVPQRAKEQGMEFPKLLKVGSQSNNAKYPVVKVWEKPKETGGDWKIKLFEQVKNADGTPYTVGEGDFTNYLYKQINAWGDGTKMQEYYDVPQPSQLYRHYKVMELSDEQIRLVLDKNILPENNVKPYTTADVNDIIKKIGAKRDC